MERLCITCGKELSEGAAFCTNCGTPAPAGNIETPQPLDAQADTPVRAAVGYRQAAPAADYPPQPVQTTAAEWGKYDVVSTGSFFGMMFLYAIPVIGWLICLVNAFAAKNGNKKNFARATLIWILIGIVFAVASYFLFRWLGKMLTEYINEALGGTFGELGELFEQFQPFQNGDFSAFPLE